MLLRTLTGVAAAALSVRAVAIDAHEPLALWTNAQNKERCSKLWDEAPQMLSNLEVYFADNYPSACSAELEWRATDTVANPVA